MANENLFKDADISKPLTPEQEAYLSENRQVAEVPISPGKIGVGLFSRLGNVGRKIGQKFGLGGKVAATAEPAAEATKAGQFGEKYLNELLANFNPKAGLPARTGYNQMAEIADAYRASRMAKIDAARTVVDKTLEKTTPGFLTKATVAGGVTPAVLASGHEFNTAPEAIARGQEAAKVATAKPVAGMPNVPLLGGGMDEKAYLTEQPAVPTPTVQPTAPTVQPTVGKLTPAQELNKMGFETRIGGVGDTAAPREGDGGMNTPTGFRWKTGGVGQPGKIIGPDEGTQNWSNKLRGIKDEKDNVTLEMMGVPSAVTAEEKVKKNLQELAAGRGPGALNAAKVLADMEGHKAQTALHQNDLAYKRQEADERRRVATENSANQREARAVDTYLKVHGQNAFEQGEDGKPVLNNDLFSWNLATEFGKDPKGYERLNNAPLLKENVINLMSRFDKFLAESRANPKTVITDEKKFRNDMWQKFRKHLQKAPTTSGV